MYLCTPKFGARFLLPANLYVYMHLHIRIQMQRYHIPKEVIGHDKRIPTVAALQSFADRFVCDKPFSSSPGGRDQWSGRWGSGSWCFSLCWLFVTGWCDCLCSCVPEYNVYRLMPWQFYIYIYIIYVFFLLLLLLLLILLPCYWPALSQVTLFAQPVAAVRKGEPSTFCMAFSHPLSTGWYAGTRRQLGYLRAARDTTARLHDVCNSCGNLAWLSQVFSPGSHFWIQFWEKLSFMLFLF